MGRVLFGMIDNHSRPIGGVKVIYQAVGALRRQGIDAYVATAVGVPAWLAGSPSVADAAILDMSQGQQITAGDLYIATDSIGPHRVPLLLKRPQRRVLFIQNHNALNSNTTVDWSVLRHIRCLTVSEYSRRYLLGPGGFGEVAVVPPGIDLAAFRPSGPRRHRIAYMPRKWPGLAERLRTMVAAPVEWFPIDGLGEAETAAALAASTVFLNLGRGEGFGLPPVEAMAAGCVVCGFAGEGTTDFATPENGFWAAEGDVEACAGTIAAALAALADGGRTAALVAAGHRTAERYTLPLFEQRMAAYVRALL